MADIDTLRVFVNERLTAVAEDIIALFVRTILGYQQQMDMILHQRQLDLINPPKPHQLSGLLVTFYNHCKVLFLIEWYCV